MMLFLMKPGGMWRAGECRFSYSSCHTELTQSRYIMASAVDQMKWREESLAPPTFAPGSLAIAVAAATAGVSYGLSLVA